MKAGTLAATILLVNEELEMTDCPLSLWSWHRISSLPIPLATYSVLVYVVLGPPNKSSLSQEEQFLKQVLKHTRTEALKNDSIIRQEKPQPSHSTCLFLNLTEKALHIVFHQDMLTLATVTYTLSF